MNKCRNWFFNQTMSYPKVIIFAVITAAITAVLNLIPALKNTSFQDIAVTPECWILFAVFIIVNCKIWHEATIKTFLFFLISQPLIYLIEVPFSSLGFGLFQYYKYWGIITLLTLPGAAIAFLIKRKDWISVAVLSIANIMLASIGADHFWEAYTSFPRHLLSFIFCLTVAVFFVFLILEKKSHRYVAFSVIVIAFAIALFMAKPVLSYKLLLPEGNWNYTMDNGSIVNLNMEDSSNCKLSYVSQGYDTLTFTNENGEILEYGVTVTGGGIFVSQIN